MKLRVPHRSVGTSQHKPAEIAREHWVCLVARRNLSDALWPLNRKPWVARIDGAFCSRLIARGVEIEKFRAIRERLKAVRESFLGTFEKR